ncbi:NAD-dependent epimerase/dehydratase family protein [Vibrio hepatarius]|uniref:NAD-dependent epimerase/dehydratase family protein n=1 Tax=Vibrio hepatarius TaxID=171383 RepID=UPI001C0A54FE
MKILMTGGTGFIGSQFIKQFQSDYEIHALVRDVKSGVGDAVKSYVYDGSIESIKVALKDVDIVLHLATYYTAVHREEDIAPLIDANICFGANLLEAMKQTGVRRIVNIGTTWQKFGDRDHSYANLYAATKQAFQELLSYYSDAHQWSSLSIHLNDTYGKADHRKKIIQLLIETAKNESSLDMSPGSQRFETCHISDVLSAVQISLERVMSMVETRNEEFSILTGDDTSLKELVGIIERVLEQPIKINWGARAYRDREVMTLPAQTYKTLPGWYKQVSIEDGIKELI